ncbi:MAG: hypothetical protein ACRD19_05615 [Terriglobia bacterium]
MKKILSCGLLTVFLTLCAGAVFGAQTSTSQLLKQTRRQQKIQRKQLQLQEKIWKKSFRGQHIPRAEQLQEKHQLQRNLRDLKMQQKDQLQALKDQQRLTKYRSAHSLY